MALTTRRPVETASRNGFCGMRDRTLILDWRNLMRNKSAVLILASVLAATIIAPAEEKVDLGAVYRIKDEGLNRSQVMEVLSYLTDVHGPRLTGSTQMRKAREWALKKLKEWGLENVHTEKFEFGRGWDLKRFSAHMVAPVYSPLIAYPKAWTPGTSGTVRAEVKRADIGSEADLEKYRGKLKGLFVLAQPAREVEAQFAPPGRRFSDDDLIELSKMPEPGRQGRFRRQGGPFGNRQLQRKINEFYVSEGVAAVIEPGRGDGGTVFVTGGGERGKDAPPVAPQVVMAVEHYNRILRMLDKTGKVELEIDIQAEFLDQDLNDYNVIAEIPGTDKKDEIVMLGAHFDSWHTGTGATDNAVGSAVAMEVMRILKATGLRPRRTIRLGLWSGEEQGLLGSRAYVNEHFASRPTPPEDGRESEAYRRWMQTPPALKPDHARFAGYWNIDNGTGKVRGIYLQGNEEVRPIFEEWLAPFRDMGATTLAIRNTGGTDHLSFDAVGLPGFQFIQDSVEYETRTHHSNMDVYDRVQPGDLMQMAVIEASMVYNTAMREEKLPRKPLPKPRQPQSTGSR